MTQKSTLLGVIIMLCAMAILPLLDVCAKFLSQLRVPIAQIVWARFFFGSILTLPVVWRVLGKRALVPNKIAFHLARSLSLIFSTGFFFVSISLIPIANSLAIFFIQPLIVTALSPIFLSEKVTYSRWIAVLIGFLGTMIIIRPGLQALSVGMFAALTSGVSMAGFTIMTRKYALDENPLITTFYTNIIGAIIMSAVLPIDWQSPSNDQWILMITLAAIAVFGHYLIAKSYTMAEASLLAPLAYTEMIVATIAGWWFFDEMPDKWTFLGVSILIFCAIYICFDEAKQKLVTAQKYEQP